MAGIVVDLFMIARADGHVGPAEEALLWRLQEVLWRGAADPGPLREMIEQVNADSPYTVLGLTPPCSRAEVRRAYRRKAAEFHPDRLGRRDIPDELRSFGEARFRAVNDAYERIRRDLG